MKKQTQLDDIRSSENGNKNTTNEEKESDIKVYPLGSGTIVNLDNIYETVDEGTIYKGIIIKTENKKYIEQFKSEDTYNDYCNRQKERGMPITDKNAPILCVEYEVAEGPSKGSRRNKIYSVVYKEEGEIDTDNKTNLSMYKKKYGKLPEVGQQVELIVRKSYKNPNIKELDIKIPNPANPYEDIKPLTRYTGVITNVCVIEFIDTFKKDKKEEYEKYCNDQRKNNYKIIPADQMVIYMEYKIQEGPEKNQLKNKYFTIKSYDKETGNWTSGEKSTITKFKNTYGNSPQIGMEIYLTVIAGKENKYLVINI